MEKVYNSGYDIKEFYGALMEQFRNLLVSLIAPDKYLLDMSENDREEIVRMAQKAGEESLHLMLNFLISREEDLRFASNPRLILEATMVRLSSLGDYLSFGELLSRLAALEKRLLSPAASLDRGHPQVPPDEDATPQSRAEKKEKREKGPESPPRGWDDFLSFLSTRSKAAHSILKEWRLIDLTEDTLEIDGGNHSFSSRYFDDSERYEQLTEYCREFFKRPIRVKIRNSRPTQAPDLKKGGKAPHVSRTSGDNTGLPQTARDLLDLFEGTVVNESTLRTVKNRSRDMEKRRRKTDERDA